MADALAHYALLEHDGTGGLGDLYRARDTRQGRTAAVKVVRPDLVPTGGGTTAFHRRGRWAARPVASEHCQPV